MQDTERLSSSTLLWAEMTQAGLCPRVAQRRGGQCCSHAFRETNSLRKTMQMVEFITPAGPRESLLLAKDPDQFF